MSFRPLVNKPECYDLIVAYESNPSDHRTYDQLASDIGITPQYLHNVRKQFKTEIANDVVARKKEMIASLYSTAWKGLGKKLAKGDSNALKMFYTMTGDLIETTQVINKYETAEEKRSRISSLLKSFSHNLDDLAKQPKDNLNESLPSTPQA